MVKRACHVSIAWQALCLSVFVAAYARPYLE